MLLSTIYFSKNMFRIIWEKSRMLGPQHVYFQTGSILEEEIPKIANFIVKYQRGYYESEIDYKDIVEQLRASVENEEYVQIIARGKDGNVVGFMSMFTGFESMAFISPWHPIVKDTDDKLEIAMSLIENAKELARKRNIERLEVMFSGITEEKKPLLEELIGIYSNSGFKLASEEIKMMLDIKKISLEKINLPDEIDIQKYTDVSEDKIRKCVEISFQTSPDRLFLSLSDKQQKTCINYWISKERDFIEEASLIMTKDNEIIGYSVVRMEDGQAEIGPFGIAPKEQGRGLGKLLLLQTLQALSKEEIYKVSLELDRDNTMARNLYEKVGFLLQNPQLYYYWKTNESWEM
ncbi:MAG: GNAT family N-acetyltransferase [Candidatus Lokiarchaeota archaeon]|nr:GNAT family N-acetyltransferase [Candidatus Lokiarchaeota archaeon]